MWYEPVYMIYEGIIGTIYYAFKGRHPDTLACDIFLSFEIRALPVVSGREISLGLLFKCIMCIMIELTRE